MSHASPLTPTMTLLTRLLPACFAAVLAACASPGLPDIEGAAARTAGAQRIDWKGLHQRLAGALAGQPEIELGAPARDGLRLQIPVADGFASGSTELQPPLMHALDALAPALAGEGAVAVHVVGHTDSQGSEMHNLQLSIGRAEAVADHLRRRGIALERLSADGRGEADPLTTNASEAGRARNRRVELQLRAMP